MPNTDKPTDKPANRRTGMQLAQGDLIVKYVASQIDR